MEHGAETLGFDPDEAAQTLGLSAKQKAFALALVRGANLTQAARAAGYSGDGAALRSQASKAAKSEKVAAFKQWAENTGAGIADTPGDLSDLRRILWKHARGADKNAALRAAEVIARVDAAEAARPKPPRDPRTILEEIAGIVPEVAMALAEQHRIAGFDLSPEQQAEAERRRRAIALDYFRNHPDEAATLASEGDKQTVALEANGAAMPSPAGPGGARHGQDEG